MPAKKDLSDHSSYRFPFWDRPKQTHLNVVISISQPASTNQGSREALVNWNQFKEMEKFRDTRGNKSKNRKTQRKTRTSRVSPQKSSRKKGKLKKKQNRKKNSEQDSTENNMDFWMGKGEDINQVEFLGVLGLIRAQ